MSSKITRLIWILIILSASVLLTGAAELKWKALTFENPGTRRLLKMTSGNYYYYRSLPEKSLNLNLGDVTTLEIRAISRSKVDKPQFILTYAGKKTTYDLKVASVSIDYYVFDPVRVTLPKGTKKVSLTCYNTYTYFRIYQMIPPKIKKTVPALTIVKYIKQYKLSNTTGNSVYYGFDKTSSLQFKVNKNRQFTLYIRSEMKDREAPVCAIYKDGVFLQQIVLPGRETSAYKAEGIFHLTTGKKVVFPPGPKLATYELRPVTDHLFIAKPVINKLK